MFHWRPTLASFVKSIVRWGRSSAGLLVTLLVFLIACGAAADAQVVYFAGAQVPLAIGSVTHPYGMAVDTNGNIYIVDNAGNSLSKLTASGVLTLEAALLSGNGSPYGIAVDGSGNLYITDNENNQVWKETLNPDNSYSPGILPFSGLNSPMGIAVDVNGSIYVADSQNNRVLKATRSGNTYTQSIVPSSPLSSPEAVAVDASGNLYIADSHHFRAVKETPSGSNWSETTIANLELYGAPPIGIAADAAGDVFILNYQDDEHYSVVRATFSGGAYTLGIVPSYGQNPSGIAADTAGDAYVVSPGSNQLFKELPLPVNFSAIDVPGPSGAISFVFGFVQNATLGTPAVVTQGASGFDFTDAGTGTCARGTPPPFVYSAGESCTVDVLFKPQFSGSRYGAVVLKDQAGNPLATGYVSGTGVAPQISYPPGTQVSVGSVQANPSGVAADEFGDVFIAESGSGNVYKETLTQPGYAQYTYFKTTVATELNHPTGVAVDGAGNVYIATSSVVLKEAPANGAYVQSQIVTDLTGIVAIAVDTGGNLYLTSSSFGNVHKETLQTDGTYTETAIGYAITSPRGVAVDGKGDIFILDDKRNVLYTETPQANGSYLQSPWPLDIAPAQNLTVDRNGNVYVVDNARGQIVKLVPQMNGFYLQTIAESGLTQPLGLAADGQGNLIYSQATGQVNMIDISDAPVITFATTKPGLTSVDSPRYQTFANAGNAPLVFRVPATGTNPAILSGGGAFALDGESTCPMIGVSGVTATLDAGSSCVWGVSFMPAYRASFLGYLYWTDNNLNAVVTGSGQEITLQGTSATADASRTTLRVGPNPVKAGLGVTVIVTVVDTFDNATIPTGTVTLTDTIGSQVVTLNGGAPVTLSNGKATLTMIPGVAGAHTITAHYGGVNNSFLSSTGQVSLTVQ
jgi:streptogramin lyase